MNNTDPTTTDTEATKVLDASIASVKENLIPYQLGCVEGPIEHQEVIFEHEKVIVIEVSENSSDDDEMINHEVHLGLDSDLDSHDVNDIFDSGFPQEEIIYANKNAIEVEEYEKGSSTGDEIENSDGILGLEHLEAIYGNLKIVELKESQNSSANDETMTIHCVPEMETSDYTLNLDKEVIFDNENSVAIEDPRLALGFEITGTVDQTDSVSISHESMQEYQSITLIEDEEDTEGKVKTDNFEDEKMKKKKEILKNNGDEQKKSDAVSKTKVDKFNNCKKTSNAKDNDKKIFKKTLEDMDVKGKKGNKTSIAKADNQEQGKKITMDDNKKIVETNLNVIDENRKKVKKSPNSKKGNCTKKEKQTFNAKDDAQKKIIKAPDIRGDDQKKEKKLMTKVKFNGPKKMIGKGWNYGTWKRFTL